VSLVAVCTAGGSTGSTTTSLLLAAMSPSQHPALLAECDPDGGDVAAWAQVQPAPGWATAASASDRTLSGLLTHTQLVSGLPTLLAPSRPSQARSAVREGAVGFAGLLAGTSEVLAYADCGRVTLEAPSWARAAQLTLLLLRQVPGSWPATTARVDRAMEAVEVLRSECSQVGVVLVGGVPYGAREVSSVLGVELFGVLSEDATGAAKVCGGWTVGRGAAKSALARDAAVLAGRVVEAVRGRQDVAGRERARSR
jgi:hypothetical protein